MVTKEDLFSSSHVAQGYAACRPRFHGQVLAMMASRASLTDTRRALDVGCGPGLSTEPLKSLATVTVGINRSYSMLSAAPSTSTTGHVAATGEVLPFGDHVSDRVTVAGAINWIQRSVFLAEAHRVLRGDGWLWIYGGTEQGQMAHNPSYADWYSLYQKRLPRPPRDERRVTREDAAAENFELCIDDSYQLQLPFDLSRWVGFLMTQAVADGREPLDGILAWLTASLAPNFDSRERLRLFGGPIWCLQVCERS